jgi:hypothetical protein
MHRSQRVKTGGDVVQHNPTAFRKRLQLSHRRRFDDIEGTKKYKAREKRFPCERYGDQSYQLTRYLINHHKLRIFCSAASRDPCSRRNSDERDHRRQSDGEGGAPGNGQRVGQRRPQQYGCRRSPAPRSRPQPSNSEKRSDQRRPPWSSAERSRDGARFRGCGLGRFFHRSSSGAPSRSSGVLSRIGSSASVTGDGIT